MPKFTIEATYRLPYYRIAEYEAETVEEACRKAVEDEWDDMGQPDFETAGETYITGLWAGELDPTIPGLPIPPQYDETAQRKAALFDEILAALIECQGELDRRAAHIKEHGGIPEPAKYMHNRMAGLISAALAKAEGH